MAKSLPRCYHDIVSLLLDIRHLSIEFPTAVPRAGQPRTAVPIPTLPAVRDLSFSISPGDVLGLVGESGSGKSISSLAIMRLLPPQAPVAGEILFTLSPTVSVTHSLPPELVPGSSPTMRY